MDEEDEEEDDDDHRTTTRKSRGPLSSSDSSPHASCLSRPARPPLSPHASCLSRRPQRLGLRGMLHTSPGRGAVAAFDLPAWHGRFGGETLPAIIVPLMRVWLSRSASTVTPSNATRRRRPRSVQSWTSSRLP